MRDFEEDWELINKVNNSLHANAVNDEYDPDYQLDILGNNVINQSDLTFIEEGKEMLIYYMNRVKELESNVAPDKPDPSHRPEGTIVNENFQNPQEKFTHPTMNKRITHLSEHSKPKHQKDLEKYTKLLLEEIEEHKWRGFK